MFQRDRFLKILVQDLNEKVTVSEEFANNLIGTVKSGGLKFDRRVTRTITPGTLIDESFMDPYEDNFLLALYPNPPTQVPAVTEEEAIPIEFMNNSLNPALVSIPIGLAWLDLSTGDFFTQKTNLGGLASAAARIGAREIVMTAGIERATRECVLCALEQQRDLVTFHTSQLATDSFTSWTPMLEAEVPVQMQSAFTTEEIAAGSLLLSYVQGRLQESSIKLQPPTRRQDQESMSIDKNSMRALEVLGTSRAGLEGGKGSLLHTIRRTVTKSGTRLLKKWITSPSMSLPIINARLDLVSCLLERPYFREELTDLLRQSHDSQRIVQKFSLGKGDADDLVNLLRTIESTNEIAIILDKQLSSSNVTEGTNSTFAYNQCVQSLRSRLMLESPSALATLIANSIDEDGLVASQRVEDTHSTGTKSLAQKVLHNEGTGDDEAAMPQVSRSRVGQKSPIDQEIEVQEIWILRKTASPDLEQLHQVLHDLRQEHKSLTIRLREEFGAPSLTLSWTPGLGSICHVKGAKDVSASLKASSRARDVKSTKSTRSFHHSEWNNLSGRIDQAKLRIKSEEQRILQELRKQVVLNLIKLRRNAVVLDELDIGCSFAQVAYEQRLIRPILNSGLDHKIVGGRHPTVKLGLEEQGRDFVSNDCLIGEPERIWLITGPNMAGKSTFLRQNALITILAQVGSFVPAEHAEIGLVDQIFTRVGSADNLFKDQSTFMVEMMETAAILHQATPQSFVIMDEIGRGTTPEDGIAVGFACLHHLYHHNRCRTLFATHFHSLADMTQDFKHLGTYCTDVAEGANGSFSFVHRLRQGVNRSSHALKVAALAGVPEVAIETARSVLHHLDVDGSQ